MGRLDEFANAVRLRLEAERDEQAAARAAVEEAMRRRRERAEQAAAAAVPLQHGVVVPLMETLARQLDVTVEHLTLSTGLSAVVQRPRTGAFPARARLSIGVGWSEETGRVWLAADQMFTPVLLPLDRTTQFQLDAAAPDTEAITAWVQERILAFVDACLEVERSDVYRQAEHTMDPVCGMIVAVGPMTTVLERGGHRYHFCSATCRDRFAADPPRYLGNPAGRARGTEGGAP
jgi:YHS domain-containing protein